MDVGDGSQSLGGAWGSLGRSPGSMFKVAFIPGKIHLCSAPIFLKKIDLLPVDFSLHLLCPPLCAPDHCL